MPGRRLPAVPPPIETRSLPRVDRATVQPSFGVPTTSSSGTKTSLRNTSLKSELPVIMRSGRTSTPGACMSITMVVMPACLGASGSVRTVANPRSQCWAPEVQTFCPLTLPPAFDAGPPGLDGGRVGAGVGLTEQLAPHQLPHQRLLDPTVDLVRCGVLVDRHDVPPGDAETGHLDPGRLELLIDEQLLHGTGVAAPWAGPVRHHEAGVDERLALRGPAQRGQLLRFARAARPGAARPRAATRASPRAPSPGRPGWSRPRHRPACPARR